MKILAAVVLVSIYTAVNLAQPVVETNYGPIVGSSNNGILEFLGVPFAKPPVGNLRWKPPQDPVDWAAPLHTQAFKPGCIQKNYTQGSTTYMVTGSEDCLYLNIWTPDTVSRKLPVMVFIHGGGNQQGAAGDTSGGTQIYNGENLSKRGNVVVVTVDYRLGPFGFLVHPGLDKESSNGLSGNYGLMDQIKSLQWVHNNISHFGGDTSKVMVFGESAGGLDIGDLLISPLAAGLFQRACIESAVPVVSNYDSAESYGINFVNKFISTGTDSEKIIYMRTLSADSLITYLGNPTTAGIVQSPWKPVIDNYVLNGTPQTVFNSGNFNKVPLIIGSNADEVSLSSPKTVYPFMVSALINSSVPASLASEGLNLYPPGSNTAEARDSYVQLLTDGQFTAPVRRTAASVAANQTEPVWRYFLIYAQSGVLNPYGSYHGIELFYVFNNWENAPLGKGPLFTAQDDSMQNNMLNYWVNFARTGNPNGLNLVQWPQYNQNTDCYLEINATPNGTKTGVRTTKCDFWDEASGYATEISNKATIERPSAIQLFQNYPNPFNPSTVIKFSIPGSGPVILKVYDILGKEEATLVNGEKPAGNYEVVWNASNLPSGIYFYRLKAGGSVQTRKMLLLK